MARFFFACAVAGDFLGDGNNSLFFAGRLMTGVVRSDASLAWFDALDKSPSQLPAFGDFDGDGKAEMIGVGFEDGIRCYELSSGRLEWRMEIPASAPIEFGTLSPSPVQGMATADWNGDGCDDAVLSIERELMCISTTSNRSGGKIRWRVKFPTQIGPPTIAQSKPDAPASILVIGSDGYVYCAR